MWDATRRAANAARIAAEHIPTVERGYIIGGGPWPGPESPHGFGYVSYGNYGKTPAIIKKIEWAFCDKTLFPKDGVVSQLLNDKQFCEALKSNGVTIHTLEQEDVLRPGAGPGIVSLKTRFKYSEAAGKVFFGKFTYSVLFDGDEHFSTFKLQMSDDGTDSVGLPGSYSDWK